MHKVTILGSGKIGSAIAKLLDHSGDYAVQVGDINEASLQALSATEQVATFVVDVTDEAAIAEKLQGQDCVISACPYTVNAGIARAAAQAGTSYFDLTEDIETTNAVRAIAETAPEGSIFAPQCGLAPGFIGILASHLCQGFDKIDEVKMRVGALPQYPSNMMMYNLTWSTRGLINEYCNPCEAVQNGRRTETTPLAEVEHFSLDGSSYECFNTSGGLGTLCETLAGKVRTLNYKTIRYPGHRDLMFFLTNEMRLGDQRELFESIFEKAIPVTKQDVVITMCTVTGWKDGQLEKASDARKIYSANIHDERWSAIQLTTAAGMCAVVDMFLTGKIRHSGFLKQEQVDFNYFIKNRFGCFYDRHQQVI